MKWIIYQFKLMMMIIFFHKNYENFWKFFKVTIYELFPVAEMLALRVLTHAFCCDEQNLCRFPSSFFLTDAHTFRLLSLLYVKGSTDY
jgi:hypothetical protein